MIKNYHYTEVKIGEGNYNFSIITSRDIFSEGFWKLNFTFTEPYYSVETYISCLNISLRSLNATILGCNEADREFDLGNIAEYI